MHDHRFGIAGRVLRQAGRLALGIFEGANHQGRLDDADAGAHPQRRFLGLGGAAVGIACLVEPRLIEEQLRELELQLGVRSLATSFERQHHRGTHDRDEYSATGHTHSLVSPGTSCLAAGTLARASARTRAVNHPRPAAPYAAAYF